MLLRTFQLIAWAVAAFGLVWLGFENSGREAPSFSEAPWFWLGVTVMALIPARYYEWD